MEGAAAVISIVALAIQVAENVKKLQGFFHALENAPRDVRNIQKTLDVISSVLKQLQDDLVDEDSDLTLRRALLDCQACVQEVASSVQDLAPLFAPEGKVYRAWTSLRALNRSKAIAKLEDRLEKAKATLTLALQSSTRRLQIAHHQSQRLALAQVFHTGRVHEQPDMKVVESSLTDHYAACRDEIATFTATVNPWLRPHLERALHDCLQETLEPLTHHADSQQLRPPSYKARGTAKSTVRSRKLRYVASDRTYRETAFGRIRFATQLFAESYAAAASGGDGAAIPEVYAATSRYVIVPALWLMKLGLSYAIDLNVSRSTHAGWKIALNTPRVLPDDSAIFKLCKQGDVVGMQQLLSQGQASVIDVDTRGCTALHVAAENHHPALCELLIGQNSNVHAQDWGSWHQTPFARACCTVRNHLEYEEDSDTEPRQIQTFRKLLGAGFDLEDAEDQQQILRIASFRNADAVKRNGQSPHFEFPSQWILKQLLPTVLEDPHRYDMLFWEQRLSESLHSPGNNPSPDILPYREPRAVRIALLGWARILDFDYRYVPGPEGSLKDLRAMLEQTGTLAFVESTYSRGALVDENLTTPTREAITRSRAFRNWVTLLEGLDTDLVQFARDEAPLMDDGWSVDTLLRLLMDDYHCTETKGEIKCQYCRIVATHLHSYWEPLWEQRMARIKSGLDPDGPFNEEELEVQARWRNYVRVFYDEKMCYFCQRDLRKQASTEIDNHPGLLEIDI